MRGVNRAKMLYALTNLPKLFDFIDGFADSNQIGALINSLDDVEKVIPKAIIDEVKDVIDPIFKASFHHQLVAIIQELLGLSKIELKLVRSLARAGDKEEENGERRAARIDAARKAKSVAENKRAAIREKRNGYISGNITKLYVDTTNSVSTSTTYAVSPDGVWYVK